MSNLNFTFPQKAKTFTYALMAIGVVSIIAAFIFDKPVVADEHYHQTRAWANILIGSFFFMAIGLAAAFFLGLQYAAESGWSTTVKRIIEAVAWFLPWGLSLMMLMFLLGQFGIHHLYAFFDKDLMHHDPKLEAKMGYFGWFWWLRTILYMVGWVFFTNKLRQNSLDADSAAAGDNSHHWKNVKLGAWFMVLFAVTSSTSSWDWLMSIDIHWFSTLFGWYVFSGMWVSAIISMILITVYLKKLGYLEFVTESTIHDLGKWMFAISFLWTYLYFSQFMLYWYADIPEEIVYFQQRWENYKPLMWTVFFINFACPMIMLMSRDSKRNFWFLTFVGFVIFVGHYLDIVMMVMPGTVGKNWTGLSWMEIGTFLGFLGLFINVVFTNLSKRPLLVKNHPFLAESLHHSI
ncbi:MAG TPA: quinol:cytochrome C oxidoreductase [Bacteroidia bacterium]|nr:quinol:cytochrome C oxidoreductase [Bacteroidia bacterium]